MGAFQYLHTTLETNNWSWSWPVMNLRQSKLWKWFWLKRSNPTSVKYFFAPSSITAFNIWFTRSTYLTIQAFIRPPRHSNLKWYGKPTRALEAVSNVQLIGELAIFRLNITSFTHQQQLVDWMSMLYGVKFNFLMLNKVIISKPYLQYCCRCGLKETGWFRPFTQMVQLSQQSLSKMCWVKALNWFNCEMFLKWFFMMFSIITIYSDIFFI